jgi:hypothetical protein
MKYIKLLIVGLCVILMVNGCGGGLKDKPGIGFIPKITEAKMTNVNTSASSNKTGDQITFDVKAEDDDQNMKTLWITVFSVDNSVTPSSGPDPIALPAQTTQIMPYTGLGPYELTELPGNYSVNLQIEDTRGNKSDAFTLGLTIE